MLGPFFRRAAVSPSRQRAFRGLLASHVVLLICVAWGLVQNPLMDRLARAQFLGYLLLTAGIVEGALLIGWRLTQLPKSQALEFLLITPLRSPSVVCGEALVGMTLLAFVGLSGTPVLLLLAAAGEWQLADPFAVLVHPFIWGCVTGLGLTAWAYESAGVRRWGERIAAVLLLTYLTIGVVAGENLRLWLNGLPEDVRHFTLRGVLAFHEYNPFGLVRLWFTEAPAGIPGAALWLELAALGLAALLLLRAAYRLKGHFHERHYRPIELSQGESRPPIGEYPLTWWAVRRVSEYSGRINLWLAGGFCLLYAAYIVSGASWPDWLGRRVFQIADGAGGVPVLSAGLVTLAAVPAAFQYGLWDQHAHDRCRRLELLLLTRLGASDYWHAAASAAWHRGRGYFAIALLLWIAGVASGKISPSAGIAASAAAVILWGLYFALGFREFCRGRNAHSLGLLLTVGLPLLAFCCNWMGWHALACCPPPGGIVAAAHWPACGHWTAGVALSGLAALAVAQRAIRRCDADLRDWYDRNSGKKVME